MYKLYKLPGRDIITIVMEIKEQNKIGKKNNKKQIFPCLFQAQIDVRKCQ